MIKRLRFRYSIRALLALTLIIAAWAFWQRISRPITGRVHIVEGRGLGKPLARRLGQRVSEIHPQVTLALAFDGGRDAWLKQFNSEKVNVALTTFPLWQRALSDNTNGKSEFVATNRTFEVVKFVIAYDPVILCVHKENDWAFTISMEELALCNAVGASGRGEPIRWKELRPTWPDEWAYGFYCKYDRSAMARIQHLRRPFWNDKSLHWDWEPPGFYWSFSYTKCAIGVVSIRSFKELYEERGHRALAITNQQTGEPVPYSEEAVRSGAYPTVLSGPIYLYVNKRSLERDAVYAYVHACLTADASSFDGYIAPSDEVRATNMRRFAEATSDQWLRRSVDMLNRH